MKAGEIKNLDTAPILELPRFMESCLQELKPFSAMRDEEFLSDKKNPAFVESYLRRSLEMPNQTDKIDETDQID